MKKILVTGNGFDIEHKLPTKYSDFISILNIIENMSDFTFEDLYSNIFPKDFDSIKSFDLDLERIKKISLILINNVWYNHFKKVNESLTWIDFENEIESVLSIIYSFIEMFYNDLCPNGYFVDLYTTSDNLGRLLEDKLIDRIVLINFNIYKGQKESGGNSYKFSLNTDFLDNNINPFYYTLNKDKISKYLLKELNQFRFIFNEYFECFVVPFYNTQNFKINNDIKRSIDCHYTFNYTPTFQNLYKKDITSYVHGNIGDQFNFVLGINEVPNSINYKKSFIPFTKLFQKLNFSTDYKFLETDLKLGKLDNDFYVFIWGHSLDSSDSEYIIEIFKLLEKEKNERFNRKIIIIVHDMNSKGKLLINLIEIIGAEKINNLMKNEILDFVLNESNELVQYLNKKGNNNSVLDVGVY